MKFTLVSKIIGGFFLFIPIGLFAQDIPIGTWRDHLPYNDVISVSYGNPIVYCATNSAVFTYDKTDNSVEKLNLVNGLSDIGVSKIRYNSFNEKVIIAYTNGNLDILDKNKLITNISFIKTSSVIGGKSINNILFQDHLAYLSTEFGIVVLNTNKLEVVETYFFGPLGSNIDTKAVAFDSTNIYAATTQGVYFANKTSVNLSDFNNWSLLPELGSASYSGIVSFAGYIFASLDSPIDLTDSIYYNAGGAWQTFIPNGLNIDNMDVLNTPTPTLIVNQEDEVDFYNLSLNLVNNISLSNSQEVVVDEAQNYWFANDGEGLLRVNGDGAILDKIFPNGPNTVNCFDVDMVDEEVWVVAGGMNPTLSSLGLKENLINHRVDGTWQNTLTELNNENGSVANDAVSVAINPQNTSQVFIGMWDHGLFELNNGEITNRFTAENSALDSVFFGATKIGALAYDDGNNLWVTSSFADDILAVKTADNEWFNYSFSGFNGDAYFDIIIDRNDYKWVIGKNNKNILVFDDNGTLDITSDDRVKVIPNSLNNTELQGVEVLSMQEDLDGEIWVGTAEGPAVFFSPSQVFDEDIKAEQIFIQQDGNTEILLGTDIINTIAIDGANRKWFGTQNSGAYLMSENGDEEVLHLTEENSPLLSNNILDIDINGKTGEIFFATDKGLISYKGTATAPNDDFSNVLVYPNPVKPDYDGVIAIRGLVENTDVKITDISGNLVFETTSFGGQAIWSGKNINGNRVKTGVYLVFNASSDGSLKKAAKILFIN